MKIRLLLVGLLLAFYHSVNCQIVVDERFTKTTLENNMEIFSDSSETVGINELIKNKRGYPFKNEAMASPNIGRDLPRIGLCLS